MIPTAAFFVGRTGRSQRRRALFCLVAVLGLALSTASESGAGEDRGFVIIVHPRVSEKTLTRDFVTDAFLKKKTRWDDGSSIEPVDLDSDSPVRERFSQSVLKRSVAAVRSYWQQRIFSGRGVPPPEARSEKAAVRHVASRPGGIGYVSTRVETSGVRIVELRD